MLARLFKRLRRPGKSRQSANRPVHRPVLELLEDRLAPANLSMRIIDDGDVGFSTGGPAWSSFAGPEVFGSDLRYIAPGGGSTASWTFGNLAPGDYRVSATWFPTSIAASDAPYTIAGGAAPLNVSANQELAPASLSDAAASWHDLAVSYTITGATLTVSLSNSADDYVEADAVRIERIGSPGSIIDGGNSGFSTAGAWQTYLGPEVFGSDLHFMPPGTGSAIATWSFAGLAPGQYRVSATWFAHPQAATNAPYTILEGATSLNTVAVNQETLPSGYSDAGALWQDLGFYTIAGSTLTVRLSNLANDYVEADAVRIDKVSAVRLAVIGDFGDDTLPEADVANLVHSWEPDHVITLGDNNYDTGSAATIDPNIGQYYYRYISPYVGGYGTGSPTNRFWPSLGNHDWDNPGGPTPYYNYFTLPGNERYYDVALSPSVRVFVIDSDPREPSGITSTSIQGQWLQSRLAATTETWKLIAFHHPPYSSGSSHGNTPALQWPFQQWGASAVLAGHEHLYERHQVGNLPYFVNGLGGRTSIHNFGTPGPTSQVRYNADYGAMLVDVNDSRITFQFITRTGAVIDSYVMGTTLLAAGSTWRYLDNGSNQGTAWRNPGFNDSAWQSGPAQLGYGDGDEARVVGYGPDANNKYITTYFRTTFNVADPSAFNSLIVRLLRDDGAVVYLNGVEVLRSNMPAGTITSTTLASAAVANADEDFFYQSILGTANLVAGTNVLAVEIHQSGVTSTDISFDLHLVGLR